MNRLDTMSNYAYHLSNGDKKLFQQDFAPSDNGDEMLNNYLNDYMASPLTTEPMQDFTMGVSDFHTDKMLSSDTPFAPPPTLSINSSFNQDGLLDTSNGFINSSVSSPLSSPMYDMSGSIHSSNSLLPSNSYNQQYQQQLHQQHLLSPTEMSSPLRHDTGSLFPHEDALISPSVESPLQDNELDQHFLIPGRVGHFRTQSTYSETSSAAHSPMFRPVSPDLPTGANSPLLSGDMSSADLACLTQFTEGFSIGDSGIANQLHLYIPEHHDFEGHPIISSHNSPAISISPDHAFQGTSPTPEITIDNVDLPGELSPYASPGGYPISRPISPAFSDTEPFPALTANQGLLPPYASRRRSQSDSDIDGGALQNSLYSVANNSSVSVSSVSSATTTSYLSPDAAINISTRGSHDKESRVRSSSASQIRERSRSRSQSASREYILELATLSPGHKKIQRHPSAFACDLCEKKFTRAYNLRSHKRTHTNERPYVCSVCDKAFARQHDRKRHEALHSGEKKFECKGVLANGVTPWGCGHKFARADALGRHFRTEAGKECIRALVEEADREKKHASNDGLQIYDGNEGAPALTLSPPVNESLHGNLDGVSVESYFPPALLEQFPMLSGLLGI